MPEKLLRTIFLTIQNHPNNYNSGFSSQKTDRPWLNNLSVSNTDKREKKKKTQENHRRKHNSISIFASQVVVSIAIRSPTEAQFIGGIQQL